MKGWYPKASLILFENFAPLLLWAYIYYAKLTANGLEKWIRNSFCLFCGHECRDDLQKQSIADNLKLCKAGQKGSRR